VSSDPASNSAAPPALPVWALLSIVFIGYVAASRLGLLLALPPGNASPLFPAAGFAMAAAVVWGRPALLAILLASPTATLWQLSSDAPITPTLVGVWVASGAGAALQAAIGAVLVRRLIAQPLLLSEPGDLARFMLVVVPLGCLTSASLSVSVLWGSGTIATGEVGTTWAAWWIGDTLGVLIGAPVTWAFIGQPRDAWAPRRWSVALPMVGVTVVLALGVLEWTRSDAERQQQSFQRDADNAVHAATARLQTALRALEAMRGIAEAAPSLDVDIFRRAALPWTIDAAGMVALGLSERVERADVAALEARERAKGRADFRVVERWSAGATPPPDDPLVVIRFIEPWSGNEGALGVNSRSIALARAAIDAAARTGRPAATAAFPLSQGGQGIVVYQALYRGEPATADERSRALRGVVFTTLRPQVLLDDVRQQIPSSLELCLLDNLAPAETRLLAGGPACRAVDASLPLHVSPLAFAGSQWDLRIQGRAASRGVGRAWPMALVGLASVPMLGALLLTITGRARRIAAAVAERTAELQQRSAELQTESAQRQRTASALRDSQHRLRNILDHAPIGVAYTDTDGRIREANPHLRELLGLTVERLAGTPIADLLHPDDRAAEAQARAKLLAGELPMAHWHLRCMSADGHLIYTRASVSVLRNQSRDGQARRMVWVIEDITEHLALEESQRARKGAEAANRAKGEFLSRMSHELRTPLNAMLGFTQLLELDRKQPLAAHQLAWTAQMRQAGWHLLHMINDTLDLARIESGHVDLEPRALDLGELVEQARTLLISSADERRISIEVHLGTGARAVIGDATRVKQILTNLISNAVKYNVEGGQVIVASRLADGERVAVDVIDAGPGLTETQRAQLFQPFNRLGREHGPIEGTGIGLVISLRLAELMGGALGVKSTPGLGSTFTLELPRAQTEPADFARDEDDGAVEPAVYRRRLVVYVEDNETNAEVMRGILALRPQVQLEVCTLGLDGLATIRAKRPSLVLLDMQLPDVDGLELLRHLQADENTSEIPIIVVSADATQTRIAQAVAAGASHYVTKPVNVAQFLAAVDELLEQLDTHFG
jgi:PAS domain S-box-containing protein